MEWRSLIQGQVLNQTVPLTSTYGGNFGSTLITVPTAVSPAILAKYAADGLTPGQPFPNNTIPADLLDPNAQALLAAGIFQHQPTAHNSSAVTMCPRSCGRKCPCGSPVHRQVLNFRTLGFRADLSEFWHIHVER